MASTMSLILATSSSSPDSAASLASLLDTVVTVERDITSLKASIHITDDSASWTFVNRYAVCDSFTLLVYDTCLIFHECAAYSKHWLRPAYSHMILQRGKDDPFYAGRPSQFLITVQTEVPVHLAIQAIKRHSALLLHTVFKSTPHDCEPLLSAS